METKYYIEFVDKNENCNFIMQSKWFATKEKAEEWLFTNFDHIDFNKLTIFVMSAEFYAEDHYGDIELVKEITTNYYQEKTRSI